MLEYPTANLLRKDPPGRSLGATFFRSFQSSEKHSAKSVRSDPSPKELSHCCGVIQQMASAFRALPVTAGPISASCRLTLRQNSAVAPFLYPLGQQQVRTAMSNSKGKKNIKEPKKKAKGTRDYQQKDLGLIDQYALCDAMRYDFSPKRSRCVWHAYKTF